MHGFTNDTSNALRLTINGFVDVIKTLLSSEYTYVLPGKIQSDRVEAEFGIYRQSSGGKFLMSEEQVVSLQIQRLKPFPALNVEMKVNVHNSCCKTGLQDSEEDLDLVERCFVEASNLSMVEKSTLLYISGYVARNEGIKCSNYRNFFTIIRIYGAVIMWIIILPSSRFIRPIAVPVFVFQNDG